MQYMGLGSLDKANSKKGRLSKAALFTAVCLLWLVLDVATKRLVDDGSIAVGQLFAGPYGGIIQFRLVHNTGAAWGIFSDSTTALGVFSLVVCALMIALFIWMIDSLRFLEIVGLALVVSGGIGNAIDRFALGYVVDFFETAFMSFPVFNVADIGVTCGIVMFVVPFLLFQKEGEEK